MIKGLRLLIPLFLCLTASQGCLPKAQTADQESCAVYRQIYAEKSEYLYLQPKTPPFSAFDPDKEFDSHPLDFEMHKDAGTGDQPVRAILELDGVEVMKRMASKPRLQLRACFDTSDDPPGFYSGSFPALLSRMKNEAPIVDSAVTPVMLDDVSPVVFLGDGDHAVVYIQRVCGWLCGGGYFLLLERIDENWVVIGTHEYWVS